MMTICLPKNQTKGDCRINGEPSEYEYNFTDLTLKHRTKGEAEWKTKTIADYSDKGMADSPFGGKVDSWSFVAVEKVGKPITIIKPMVF